MVDGDIVDGDGTKANVYRIDCSGQESLVSNALKPLKKEIKIPQRSTCQPDPLHFSSEVEWWYHPIEVAPADLEDDTQENCSLFGFQLQSFWELFQI